MFFQHFKEGHCTARSFLCWFVGRFCWLFLLYVIRFIFDLSVFKLLHTLED